MDESEMERAAALRKKRTFRKFTFRGIELEKLLDLNHEEFAKLIHARARRRIYRGLKSKPKRFIARLRKVRTNRPPPPPPQPIRLRSAPFTPLLRSIRSLSRPQHTQ